MFFGNHRHTGTACLTFCPQGVALAWVVAEKGLGPVVRAVAHALDRQEVVGWIKTWKLQRVPFVGLFHPSMYPLLPIEAPPELSREEWPAAMRWHIADRLQFPVEEAVVELFECSWDKQTPMLYVAAARRQEVVQCAKFFQGHRLPLAGIGIWELALAGLVHFLTGDQGVYGLLYLDGETTLFVLIEGRLVHLVRRLAPGEPVGWLADDVVGQVKRSLDYFATQARDKVVSGLFLLSPVWETGGLQQTLQQKLGMPVRQCLEAAGMGSDEASSHCLPAIGAAWRQESYR